MKQFYQMPMSDEPARLDQLLVKWTGEKRKNIQDWIKEGFVEVDQKTIKKSSFQVKPGASVCLDKPEALSETNRLSSVEPIPEAVDFDIVYEDDAILVINKPRGVVVYPTAQHQHGTLVQGLLYRHISLARKAGEDRPGIVHRIDKDTSGLMVVAKTDEAYDHLVEGFAAHEYERYYYAIVEGIPDIPRAKINLPIGRDPKYRTRFAVVEKGGKEAITHYRVIASGPKHALVECVLETGRTHQIRVHLAYLGHPLFGDGLYGHSAENIIAGQALHAYRLVFKHPITGNLMDFKVEIPEDFAEVCKKVQVSFIKGEDAVD